MSTGDAGAGTWFELRAPRQIRFRDFAKKYDLSIVDVESVAAKFRLFDEDGSGGLSNREFLRQVKNRASFGETLAGMEEV